MGHSVSELLIVTQPKIKQYIDWTLAEKKPALEATNKDTVIGRTLRWLIAGCAKIYETKILVYTE